MPSLPAILAPSISPRRINAVRFGTKIGLDGEEQRWRRRKQQQRRPSRRPSIGWTGDLHDDQAAGALFLVVLSCNPHDCCGRRLAALLPCSCHAAPRKIHEMAVETCMHTSSGLVVSCQMQNFRFSFRRDKRVLATEI